MKPYIHANNSAKRFGGEAASYIDIHQLMDVSKAVEPSNRHRIFFHNSRALFWLEMIFGNTRKNSDGKTYSVRDIGEQHILEDFGGRFIPNLSDYFMLVSDSADDQKIIDEFYQQNTGLFSKYPQIKEVMYAPLWDTGKIKSLLLTHNSWFIGNVLTRIFPDIELDIKNINVSPTMLFGRMEYDGWLNGNGNPPSFQNIADKRKKRVLSIPEKLFQLPPDDSSDFPGMLPKFPGTLID